MHFIIPTLIPDSWKQIVYYRSTLIFWRTLTRQNTQHEQREAPEQDFSSQRGQSVQTGIWWVNSFSRMIKLNNVLKNI